MEKYALNFLDKIFINFSPGTAYVIIATVFIIGGAAYIIPIFLSHNQLEQGKIAENFRKTKLKNFGIALLAIGGLLVVGYFFVPTVSKWIWDYGNDGRPSVEEQIEEQNKFLPPKKVYKNGI